MYHKLGILVKQIRKCRIPSQHRAMLSQAEVAQNTADEQQETAEEQQSGDNQPGQ